MADDTVPTADDTVRYEQRDDVVELSLSKAVNVTNTSFVRSSLDRRMEEENLDEPPVELVWFHVLVVCTRGSGRHMVDFEEYELSPGTAIWIRPGQVQRWSSTHDDFDADVVVFESSSVPDLPLFDRLLAATVVTQLGADAAHLRRQVEWMSADLEANADEATAAAVVSVIIRVVARQARRDNPDADTPRHRLTHAFVESIDDAVHERSVRWHAQRIGASTRSLARATSDVFGQTPKDIIDGRVILEAQRRLAWSTDDVATIARSLRFSDASNFTKYFRSRTGMPPSEFREAISGLGAGPPLPASSPASSGRRSRGTPAPAPR